MKVVLGESLSGRHANWPTISLWPLGHASWVAVRIFHLALTALVLGSPLPLCTQTSSLEEPSFTTRTDWTNVTSAGLTTLVTDPAAVQSPQRFSRLKTPPQGKTWLTVAAVTMTSQTNTEANLQAFFSYLDQAAGAGADLVVFPEVALQGCPPWAQYRRIPTAAEMTYVRETAETVPGPSTDQLVAKATELGIHVVFGMTEKDEAGTLYNAAVFLGPAGVIGTHHKSILLTDAKAP